MNRILNGLLLLCSLFCYLEWARQSAFLFEVEYGLFFKANASAEAMVHPLIALPLLGQLLLLWALFSNPQTLVLTFIGMSLLAILVLLIFVIGVLSSNIKIWGSTLPFISCMIYTLIYWRKNKQKNVLR